MKEDIAQFKEKNEVQLRSVCNPVQMAWSSRKMLTKQVGGGGGKPAFSMV